MKPEIRFKALVDRIEGESVVLLLGEEERQSIEFPKEFVPDVNEGDVLSFRVRINFKKTKNMKDKVKEIIQKLKNKNR